MSRKSLHQLYTEHTGKVSDKWSLCLTEYDRLFDDYRDKPVRLLEIGIQNGGSLEIWSKYFSNASALIGCDINPDCARLNYDDPRIVVIVGDANAPDVREQVLLHSPQIDIIIDDGSHLSSDIIKSFALYFPHIAKNGVFIAEDLHCSYWSQFEGGLFDPYSSISFFKRLADVINHEHWGIPKARADILRGIFTKYGCEVDAEDLAQVHSVEFINSMCVVRKAPAADNALSRRVIAGTIELVVPGLEGKIHEPDPIFDQSHNPWSARITPPDEAIESTELALANAQQQIASLNQTVAERDGQIAALNQTVAERDGQIAALNQIVAERDGQIAALNQIVAERDGQIANLNQAVAERDGQIAHLYNSNSWRITRPLRFLKRQMKRVRRVAQLAMPAIKREGGLKNTLKKAMQLYRREGLAGIRRGFRIVASTGQTIPTPGSGEFDRNDYAEWIRRYDTVTDESRTSMHARIDGFSRKPLISVVMPTYNPRQEWLIEAIESVRKQIYPYWELCIADDASTDKAIRPILEHYAREDSRIRVVFRERNGHISAASNSALELATGEWVALLDHDDLFSEHALFHVADAINKNPDIRLIYSDEDKINEVGTRSGPYFKCDWNVDLFYSQNMFSHLGIYHAELLRKIGGFRLGMEGSQDYDLALRCIENIEPNQIHHIPRVLYHWRMHAESTAQFANSKPYAMLAGESALNEHFKRRKIDAKVELIGYGYRVRYSLPDTPPLVSLIIPTRNGLDLIRKCIESILQKTTYPNYEILIVDNGSDDPATLEYFINLEAEERVRLVRDNRPFNYSALNNAAVMLARGEVLGLLNNDLEVISPEWLSEMVSIALQPGVGAVGARLWYPSQTLQHGGIILGLGASRSAGHAHHQMPKGHHGYFGRASLINSFSAVSAACLVIRKAIYEDVCGLNETDLQVGFNDVDFCLRLREKGYRNVWTPYAELYHHESATRGHEDTPEKLARFEKEVLYMKQRWSDLLLNDPAYSPNLTLDHSDFSLSWPPRVELLAPPVQNHQRTQLTRVDKALCIVDRKGFGLEIGPSHNPLTSKKQGFNVHILDHASAEELRTKYKGHGVNLENIEEVDYVWHGEPLHELVGREQCYDWIIASHVIEHTPDLIIFLTECERLLKPDGVLSLIIPDKRYCFDYFNATTSTGELLDALEQKRKRPSPGKVFDHFAGAAKRNGLIAWGQGDAGTIGLVHDFGEARAHWEKATLSENYIDVHNWRFTPSSFRLILADLQMLSLTGLCIAKEFDTEGCEFFVALRKTQATAAQNRLELLNRVRVDG